MFLRCAGGQEFLMRVYHPMIPSRLAKRSLKLVYYNEKEDILVKNHNILEIFS